MVQEELANYITTLDDADHKMIDQRVAERGIENYLSQQLIYLDCSRIINDMRMMQTIGYPYQREITSYIYALQKLSQEDKPIWVNKLLDLHHANLKYEETNPPVWYGGKKAKDKWDKEHGKHPRRKKYTEGDIPGMCKELSNKERLKRLSANFGNLTFKIKPPKKDD